MHELLAYGMDPADNVPHRRQRATDHGARRPVEKAEHRDRTTPLPAPRATRSSPGHARPAIHTTPLGDPVNTEIRTVIVVDPDQPTALIANTVGVIAIGIGAKLPTLAAARLEDAEGRSVDISSDRPLPVLRADGHTLNALLLKALDKDPGGVVVPFPAFARAMNAYEDYEAALPHRDLATEPLAGLGLAGPRKWVASLTGSLGLLR